MFSPPLGNSYTVLNNDMLLHAQQAGADCTQIRHEAKLAHCGPHLSSLLRQNISCTPTEWSACGHPHQDTLTVLRSLSKSIARKPIFVSGEVVYQKTSLQHHPGYLETQRPANSGLLAPRGPFWTLWTLFLSFCLGPLALSFLWSFGLSRVLFSLGPCCF